MMLRTTRDHEANLVRSRLTPRSASDQASDRSRQSHGSARPTSLITETAIPCFSEGHLPAHGRNGRLWLSRTWVFPLRNQGQMIHRAPPPSVRAVLIPHHEAMRSAAMARADFSLTLLPD
jgi:hypothetical protein